ncbi:NADPH:quinone reductase-like Zn-dependent oxidoreductase [Catalinimonas alkaloidigena]|uniref:NAD(P)-dependent alcohol dehydrogenase n=1 Tax=Catalinimonas alkaloidigena TaxID=1075417 RepID=UPI002404A476|nr:NAD(P)-dependent alcohol dehydrogenase [Catalinimonas alkaloidigena]MDF9795611.1 NADPH:quinone reductase-like Zn-dependent oxidoreductase [Catalinimonas alkaloidigena]
MKAILFEQYGPPEKVLSLREVEKPSPKHNEVLIKIKATAVNDYDWSLVRGQPYLYRLMFGFLKPKHPISGMELSGIVAEIGADVHNHKVGEAVFGDISEYGFGTFAEYICINKNAVIKQPETISFEEAAALPHASTLALQALRDIGKIEQGQKVLINGGGGGVGTIGLQLAKLYHCHVTGVDAQEKIEMMKSIGFDTTIDYKQINFTKAGEKYDLILDCKTNKSAFSYLSALKVNGRYVTIGGKVGSLIKVLLWSKLINLFSTKKLQVLSLKPNKDLDYICELFREGKIKCEIDGPYALAETPGLIQYFGEGKHKGKVVIKTDSP